MFSNPVKERLLAVPDDVELTWKDGLSELWEGGTGAPTIDRAIKAVCQPCNYFDVNQWCRTYLLVDPVTSAGRRPRPERDVPITSATTTVVRRRDQRSGTILQADTIRGNYGRLMGEPMDIRRAVADFKTDDIGKSLDFYVGVLGFELAMDLGWIATVVSTSNPAVQISFLTHDESASIVPDLSIEVEDVDGVYEKVRATGLEVVHPLTDEPWGVTRFFVRDPNGRVVNVMKHLPPSR